MIPKTEAVLAWRPLCLRDSPWHHNFQIRFARNAMIVNGRAEMQEYTAPGLSPRSPVREAVSI